MLLRQAVGLGAVVLVLVLLVLGIKGCVNSRQERALKDYNRSVTAIVNDSDNEVGKPFFDLMASAGEQTDQLNVQINQLRLTADDDLRRARSLDVPGEMRAAHDHLLLVLSLRADGLRKIADQIGTALGRGAAAQRAVSAIAGEMQEFLASDVIYSVRVAPLIKEALDNAGVSGQTISASKFMADVSWMSPDTVAQAIGSTATGGDDGDGEVASGLHGHGLVGVAVGTNALQPEPATNRVPAAGVVFTIRIANQGEHDERNVKVTVRVRSGGRTISSQTKTIGQTKTGTEAVVDIRLERNPPAGAAVVEVSVQPVAGEQKTDNNSASYTVIFEA